MISTMKNYLKTWSLFRAFRLVLGISIGVQGVVTKDWLFIGAGVLFSLMPLINIGCCGTAGCSTPVRKSTKSLEEVNYEEIR